jgi:membrane protein HdeD
MVAIEKMPGWVRLAEIVLGLVSLLSGLLVIAYPSLGLLTLVVILAVGLIFLGSRDIVLGTMGTYLPKWLRAADIAFGVLAFILSVVVIASPGVAVTTLIIFLYFALFVRGVAALSVAGAARMLPPRLRAASAAVGVLSIILALVFLILPGLAIGTLIFLLSIGLLFVGIEAIASGIIGREIVPLIGSAQRKI